MSDREKLIEALAAELRAAPAMTPFATVARRAVLVALPEPEQEESAIDDDGTAWANPVGEPVRATDPVRKALAIAANDLDEAARTFEGLYDGWVNAKRFAEKAVRARVALAADRESKSSVEKPDELPCWFWRYSQLTMDVLKGPDEQYRAGARDMLWVIHAREMMAPPEGESDE